MGDGGGSQCLEGGVKAAPMLELRNCLYVLMQTTNSFAMAKEATSARKTYRREDGSLMVEIRHVNGELAVSLGLINPRRLTPLRKTPLQVTSVVSGRDERLARSFERRRERFDP